MYYEWEPRTQNQKRDLLEVVYRCKDEILEREQIQFDKIMCIINEYQKVGGRIGSSFPIGVASESNTSDGHHFLEYALVRIDVNGRYIYNVIDATINDKDMSFDSLHICTEKNIVSLDKICKISSNHGLRENRISPFGGSSRISKIKIKEQDIKYKEGKDNLYTEYTYDNSYMKNGYAVERFEFVNDNTFAIDFSKIDKGKSERCGYVKCTDGNLTWVAFSSKKDFKEICKTYIDIKPEIFGLLDRCIKHSKEKREISINL